MKLFATVMVIAQLAAASAFCQTTPTAGAWSVVSSADTGHHRSATMIQTTSEEQYMNNAGRTVEAKLDAICVKGRLAAIAVDTNSIIDKSSVNLGEAADTTMVDYTFGDDALASESWALSDNGRVLSPYSDILQGRRTRDWAAHIATADKLVLDFHGSSSAEPVKVTFDIGGFSQALSTAGCSY